MLYFETKNWKVVKNLQDFRDLLNNDWKRVIKKWRKKRTLDQNSYYFWLLWIVESETWQDTETIHEKMKMKFLYVPSKWNELAYCRSTTQLDTKEFTDYIENIKNFFAEFGIILPDANDFENFITK